MSKPNAPLRVMHHFCTNFGVTGVETFVLQLCAAQGRLGIVPEVSLETESREQVVTALEEAGVLVHPLPSEDGRARLPRKLATARLRSRRIRALVSRLRSRAIDILHLHAVGVVGFDAFVAGALARTPGIVVTHHATLAAYQPNVRLVDRMTFLMEKQLARRIVMPYAAAAEELCAHGMPADHVRVIPFCIDEKAFPIGKPRPLPTGTIPLVILGRVFDDKGHRELLQAMAKIRGRYPNLRLRIIGDGPLRGQIEALSLSLGIADLVEWTGWVAHEDVPRLLADGAIVVLPSYMRGETFPLSLIEGMALGLPAIGSRWYGIPDVIGTDGAGVIVEPRDVTGLADAIAALVGDPGAYERASAAAIARVQAQFTGQSVAEAYASLYREARSKGE